MPRKKLPASKRVPKPRSNRRPSVRSWLEKQSQKELIEFILEVAQAYPRIHEDLANRASLKQGRVNPVREAIRHPLLRQTGVSPPHRRP